MKFKLPRVCALLALATAAGLSAGCGRDTRVNSDPMPGRPSRAEGGEKAVQVDPNRGPPAASSSTVTVGTDSTGRPSDASGGTVGGGAGSGTSGTRSESATSAPPGK